MLAVRRPIGGRADVTVFPDPRYAKQALLAPTCPPCMALPNRRERERTMLGATWPELRWKSPREAVAEWFGDPWDSARADQPGIGQRAAI